MVQTVNNHEHIKYFFKYVGKISVVTRARARLWTGISLVYIFILIIFFFLKVPLRSDHLQRKISAKLKDWKSVSLQKLRSNKELNSNLDTEQGESRTVNVLSSTFQRVDANKDELLSYDELNDWIGINIKTHLISALRENFLIFNSVDIKPRNGQINWEEYNAYFLKNLGYDEVFIKQHNSSLKGLPRSVKETIMKNRAAWSEAARSDSSRLTLDEFLSFRHPESSHATILEIVDGLLAKLDISSDGFLTKSEYSDSEMNNIPDDSNPKEFEQMRYKEFEVIDVNNDGKLEKKELLKYYDPHHAQHAQKEAVALIAAADADNDGKLSLDEVLNNADLFMRSKMIDVARSFHDEF